MSFWSRADDAIEEFMDNFSWRQLWDTIKEAW